MSGMNLTPHHVVRPILQEEHYRVSYQAGGVTITETRCIFTEGDETLSEAEADFLPEEADSAIVVARRSDSDTPADSPASPSQ